MEGCKASSLDEVMDAVTHAQIALDYGPFLDMSSEVCARNRPSAYNCIFCRACSQALGECFCQLSMAIFGRYIAVLCIAAKPLLFANIRRNDCTPAHARQTVLEVFVLSLIMDYAGPGPAAGPVRPGPSGAADGGPGAAAPMVRRAAGLGGRVAAHHRGAAGHPGQGVCELGLEAPLAHWSFQQYKCCSSKFVVKCTTACGRGINMLSVPIERDQRPPQRHVMLVCSGLSLIRLVTSPQLAAQPVSSPAPAPAQQPRVANNVVPHVTSSSQHKSSDAEQHSQQQDARAAPAAEPVRSLA